jgi:hypothetical protein
MWEPARDFAHAKLPTITGPNLCSVQTVNGSLQLYVVTPGQFLIYNIPADGGECTLLKSESILVDEE